MESWYDMLEELLQEDGERMEDLVCTLSEAQLKEQFHAGFGSTGGEPFTAWGKNWVYFPLSYDGSKSVGHAPRNPCDIAMRPQ